MCSIVCGVGVGGEDWPRHILPSRSRSRLIADQDVLQQVAALPAEVLDAHAELLTVLALTPWNVQPQHTGTTARVLSDDGRSGRAGPGRAGGLPDPEDQQEVHLLLVQWRG
jgi:hypothetical protein